MLSYWEKEYWQAKYDFAIVGSGIVGLSTAIELKKKFPDRSIVVLERGHLPHGASTKNAGFACFGTIGELLNDIQEQSEEEVIQTVKMRWTGLKTLLTNVPQNEMHYFNNGGYELVDSKETFEKYLSNKEYINALLKEAINEEEVFAVGKQNSTQFFYSKLFFNRFESQLNPALMIKYLLQTALKMGVEVINNFDLVEYDRSHPYKLHSTNGLEIKSEQLIFCTNAFTKHFFETLDIVPARNQVIVTSSIDDLKWKGCYHYDRGYVYFRDVGSRLLIGGARNFDPITEQTQVFGENEKIIDHLKLIISELIGHQEFTIDYKWSGIIATGLSKMPIVKKLDEGIYVGVRLGGMGVAIGSGVAQELVKTID